MGFSRLLKHLITPRWWTRRHFRAADRSAIRAAIAASEGQHRGELRFVAEGPMPLWALLKGQNARQRATDLFIKLGVAQTNEGTGVLIYVQMLDRQVEILTDLGIADKVAPYEWQRICRNLESAFAIGDYRRGVLEAVDAVTAILTRFFPANQVNRNELDDEPVIY